MLTVLSSILFSSPLPSLERLLLVGEGQGQAGKRRQWARREEEKARWDREAQWLVRVTGRPLSQRGNFPTL